ncbi:MAG TPA: hypothetical protein VNE71_17440 [Myxococcota bacterium]|jgi:hypothetical protein|nr:hypothetical protein [Myxococcota bacterium]
MDAARIYKTRLALRIAVATAGAFWLGVLLVLLGAPGAEPRAVLGATLFVAFFAVFTVVYGRTSITVTDDGIVAATPFRRRPVRWDEIRHIVVQDGLGGRVYAVFTRRGRVQFTSLFARHGELFELLLERADLSPQRFPR